MTNSLDLETLAQATVLDSEGDKVGSVGQIYLDNHTRETSWVTVNTGLFGLKETFIPLEGAKLDGTELHVPFEKSFIKNAPNMDIETELTPEDEARLYEYFGITGHLVDDVDGEGRDIDSGDAVSIDVRHADDHHDTVLRDRDRVDIDADRDDIHRDRDDIDVRDGDVSVVRRDAHVVSDEERVAPGRVRLVKHVVRDEKSITVPVDHEDVPVVRESIARVERDVELGDVEGAIVREPVVDADVIAADRGPVREDLIVDDRDVTIDVAREEVDRHREDADRL